MKISLKLLLLFALAGNPKAYSLTQRELEILFVDKPTDHYLVLGISAYASEEEIKKSYRKLAQKNHPDRGGNEELFKKIKRAYEVLSNTQHRALFDEWRRGQNFATATSTAKPPPTYPRWQPPRAEPDPVYKDPRKAANFTKQQKTSTDAEAPKASQSARKADPLERIPKKFLFEGSFPNYYAAAGVKGTSTLAEIHAAIKLKEIRLRSELEEEIDSQAKRTIERRIRLLEKAKTILLDPQASDEYLQAAQKIILTDPFTGKKITFYEQLSKFVPANPTIRPAATSTKECGKWYDFLFRN